MTYVSDNVFEKEIKKYSKALDNSYALIRVMEETLHDLDFKLGKINNHCLMVLDKIDLLEEKVAKLAARMEGTDIVFVAEENK